MKHVERKQEKEEKAKDIIKEEALKRLRSDIKKLEGMEGAEELQKGQDEGPH